MWPRLLPWLPISKHRGRSVATTRCVDIVAERFDLGVRLGGHVAKDMIAVRSAPDMQMTVVGNAASFAGRPQPQSPQDVAGHECIALRQPAHMGLKPWTFGQDGETVTIHPAGRLVFHRNHPMIDAGANHHGLAWLPTTSQVEAAREAIWPRCVRISR